MDFGGGICGFWRWDMWILEVGYVDCGGVGVRIMCVCVCVCVGIWVGVWGLWGEGVEIMGVGIRRCGDYMSGFVGGEVDVEVIRMIQATYSVVRFYMYAQSVWGKGEGMREVGREDKRGCCRHVPYSKV